MKQITKGNVTVKYGVRSLPCGNFGINVKLYRDGALETHDMNTMPWPSAAVAMERSERSAKAWLEQEAS